ncbi:MAG: HlyD family efflux transporter periplasmic adaptor subunit [Deltaproteobacteria bacterium]|nr:HlyD family efflux transporter periplasmic adaptor subunit [Deltaproteobacteria bacterium]
MKKVIVATILFAAALTGAIAWKIQAQEAAEHGPPAGSGVVEGEAVDLSSRLGARINEVLVTEGASVAAGDVVLTLDCDEPEARLAEAVARLGAARAQAEGAGASASAAHDQSRAARASVTAAGANIAALDAQSSVAEREAIRVEEMGTHAALSRRDQARSTATRLEAQAAGARAARSASRRQAAAARSQAGAASAQAEAALQSIAAVEAIVRSAQLAVAECQIIAPRSGVVERVYYEPGELVMPGSVVARIVDPAFVRATFYLPNGDVDTAVVGRHASVEADAYPGRTFEATVHRVSLEAEFTPRNIQTRTDRDRLVFPVEVRVPNDEGLLRTGMPVVVTLGEDS